MSPCRAAISRSAAANLRCRDLQIVLAAFNHPGAITRRSATAAYPEGKANGGAVGSEERAK